MHNILFTSALLVEDEPNLASTLQIALKKLGISTRWSSTLSDARAQLKASMPEFVLLDRTLPDGDGMELCTELRHSHYSGVILILTASGKTADRVQGLNLGADDYLPKPFSWEELEARIRALSRRRLSYQNIEHQTEHWKIDDTTLQVHGPTGWISLTPLEFKLASYLISQPKKVISRSALLKEVWGFNLLPKTRTVDHFMGRLRKYFEQNPEEPRHFLTIRGAGYKFEP